jgi:hypothetical protein
MNRLVAIIGALIAAFGGIVAYVALSFYQTIIYGIKYYPYAAYSGIGIIFVVLGIIIAVIGMVVSSGDNVNASNHSPKPAGPYYQSYPPANQTVNQPRPVQTQGATPLEILDLRYARG